MAAAPTDRDDRPHDLIVFGATSFVGEILCRHLVERHGSSGELRWAMAGRSRSKLESVAAGVGAEVPLLVADAASDDDMASLADSARLVVSTVGPYARFGSALVAAVAAAGTDYCDLTGEPQWIQRMIDAHHTTAVGTGARIVHSCGFDSIPSDLGVWFTQQAAEERLGAPADWVAMRVKAMKGAASGGTVASGLNVVDEVKADPSLRKVLGNPYALAPADMRSGIRQPDVTLPKIDPASGQWIAPFVMASINTRIVQRSHALLGRPWGEEFRYDEAMLMGGGPVGLAKASALAGGLAAFMGAAAVPPTRALLERFVLPAPGEGPSPEQQAAGFFDIRFHAGTGEPGGDAPTVEVKVTGDADPGYGSTAKMLGEAAVLLGEIDRSELPGGSWTPATALGLRGIDRLREHAGLTFDILP